MKIIFEGKKPVKPKVKPVQDAIVTESKGFLGMKKEIVLPKVEVQKMMPNTLYYEASVMPVTFGLKKKQYFKEKRLFKKFRDSVVLIKMGLRNGSFREFLIPAVVGSFVFNNGLFLIDPKMKYYIIDRDIWAFDFMEDISLPLKSQYSLTSELEEYLQPLWKNNVNKPLNPYIDTGEILRIVEASGICEVMSDLDPQTLKRSVDAQVMKEIVEGARLDKVIKVILVIMIVIAVIVFFDMIVSTYGAGIFQKIGSMFHKGG
jgi:hypothetical protein